MQQWLTMNTQLICVILCTQVYRCILRVTRRGELLSTTATQVRHSSLSIRCGSISELRKRGTNSIEMCSVFTGAKWTKVQLRFNSLLLNFNSWRKCTQKKLTRPFKSAAQTKPPSPSLFRLPAVSAWVLAASWMTEEQQTLLWRSCKKCKVSVTELSEPFC